MGEGKDEVRRDMGYEFLEDIAIADVAFRAWGRTTEELFAEAARATTNVMIRDLDAIEKRTYKEIQVQADTIDLLLFNFLQEVIYYKDAETLMLVDFDVQIVRENGEFQLRGTAAGERLDPERHPQVVDVKAVTLHRFEVSQDKDGWTALVILDI